MALSKSVIILISVYVWLYHMVIYLKNSLFSIHLILNVRHILRKWNVDIFNCFDLLRNECQIWRNLFLSIPFIPLEKTTQKWNLYFQVIHFITAYRSKHVWRNLLQSGYTIRGYDGGFNARISMHFHPTSIMQNFLMPRCLYILLLLAQRWWSFSAVCSVYWTL